MDALPPGPPSATATTLGAFSRGRTGKKLTSTLVIQTFLSFDLADIFKKYGSLLIFKKAKKNPISILTANNEANTNP